MKAVMIVYNESVDLEVAEALAAAGVEDYTKLPRILGSGPGSGPRLNDTVWPGANNALLVITDDGRAAVLVERIRDLRKDLADMGLRAFWWNVEGMV